MEEQMIFSNRMAFRDWLSMNHASSKGIWMVFGKTDQLRTVKPEEALEEALCFGWIDGQLKSIDETRYIKKFTPGQRTANGLRRTAIQPYSLLKRV